MPRIGAEGGRSRKGGMKRKHDASERLRSAELELKRSHREHDGSEASLERCNAAVREHFFAWALVQFKSLGSRANDDDAEDSS